jgi:hypothetical protein
MRGIQNRTFSIGVCHQQPFIQLIILWPMLLVLYGAKFFSEEETFPHDQTEGMCG